MSWKKTPEEFRGPQKKSKRAPFHTGIVVDEVEKKRDKMLDDEMARKEKDRRENEQRRKP